MRDPQTTTTTATRNRLTPSPNGPTNFSLELYASDGSRPTGIALASATNLTVTTGNYTNGNGTGSVNTFNSGTANASELFGYIANAGAYALVLGGASDTAIYLSDSISAPTANGALSYVGMAEGSGTPTIWSFNSLQNTYFAIGTTGTGSSSPSSPSSVPDAGSSAAGLGLAMAGLHLLRRRLHRPLNK